LKPFQESAAELPAGMRVKAPTVDLSGKRFGRLVAIKVIGKHANRSLLWHCECDCGNTISRSSSSLRKVKGVCSCGCYLREFSKQHLANHIPWNKGKSYRFKSDTEPYANSAALKKAVIRLRGNSCELCGWNKARCDVHHKLPRSIGGLHTIDNVIILCPNCHRIEHEHKGSHAIH
jgi:5-methylcytosine-specific restriction endonuclease McrA